MTSIAYVANSFPEASEAYVSHEILELRRHGCRVLPCSFRKSRESSDVRESLGHGTAYVFPLAFGRCLLASWLCISKFAAIADLVRRAVRGPETFPRRMRTLLHTWLGAYLAVLLRAERVEHIHVHHGFFASWCAMVAARLLDVGFSMTLHGSDLLVRADYLECKLQNCRFCFTVSEFNRNHVLNHYPIARDKVAVHRIGVDLDSWRPSQLAHSSTFTLVSVGRLHPVKNHSFLLLACHSLKTAGVPFRCLLAGDGPEREKLARLISELGLEWEVRLLGQVPQAQLSHLYAQANAVVLTSHSEGIPVTLMEAMAMERVVLAPAITGIPELVSHGKTGFLYKRGSLDDFLTKVNAIAESGQNLNSLRHAARRQIERNYESRRNLASFAQDFLARITGLHDSQPEEVGKHPNENSLLQQVQLRV